MPNNTIPVLSALLDCLCQQLVTDGHPVCECCIFASDEPPPMTGCDCVCEDGQGTAWARMGNATWAQTELTKCPIGPWRVPFQIGVYRCVSVEPQCADTMAEAVALAEDAASLSRAVLCCDVLAGYRHSVGNIQILGPMGGCIGVALDVVVEMATL